MDDVDDVTNITGIAQLLDYNGSEDLNELEQTIIGGSVEKQTSKSEVDQYKEHLNRLGSFIGAPVLDDDDNGDDDQEDECPDDESDEEDEEEDEPVSDRYVVSSGMNFERNTYKKATEEQKKQSVLSNVMKDMDNSNNAFQIEREIESDDKAMLLEDIDTLMVNMRDMGVNLDRIPNVDAHSSMVDIKNIHKEKY